MPFNPTREQQAILAYALDRHARILAGPGTGKSATVVSLLSDLMARPEPPRVKLLTFTRAATAELASKVSEHPAVATERPSTIHSFALLILLQNPGASNLPRPIRIADDWERKRIINKTLGRRIGVPAGRIDNLFKELAANWEALGPAELSKVKPEERARFLGGWTEHRSIYGYTMLAEIPFAARHALLAHDDLAGADFDLLVVDEYQDLNSCDLELLYLLSEKGSLIVGVGDDDQSIYSFRRAAPEGIRRFKSDYPGSADFPLSVTHRCGRRIIAWASHVIEGDLSRPQNRLRLTPATTSPDGEVALLHYGSATAEAEGIARLVEKLINVEGISPKDILILLRGDHNGSWSGIVKEALERHSIPSADPESILSILDEPSNRRSLAILRLHIHREDSLAWATLLELTSGVGEGAFDAIYERSRKDRVTFGSILGSVGDGDLQLLPATSRTRVADLVTSVLAHLEQDPAPAEKPDSGWAGWIAELPRTELFTPSESLLELLSEIEAISEVENFSLERFLNQIAPVSKDLAQSRSDGVRIMSMAASKGLTVEATILPGLENGVIPRREANREEERRLLYVAMTRSKKFLFATWSKRRTGPTARAGDGVAQQRRTYSEFLIGGPVETQDGNAYTASKWH